VRLPRDLSGTDLVARLKVLGYEPSRQSGSHIRLTTWLRGEHHITIPAHDPLRVGTLGAIIAEVAGHHGISREQLLHRLFS